MLEILKKAIDLLDRLTWHRVALATFAGVLILFGTYAWDHREQMVPALAASTGAQMALGVSAMAMILGLMGSALVARMDRKSDTLESFLREDVTRLTLKIEQAEVSMRAMQATMNDVLRREAQCQHELNRYRHRLERAEDTLRKAGHIPPARTDWGSI